MSWLGLLLAGPRPGIALPTPPVIVSQATAESFFQRGEQRYWKDDFRGAIDNYTQAIRLNPNFAYAYINRGLCRFQLKDFQRAIADYTQTIRLNPNFAYAYTRRGEAYYWLANYQRALADSDKALQMSDNGSFIYRARLAQRRLAPQIYIDTAYAIRGAAQMGLKDYRAAQADLDRGANLSLAAGTNGNGFALYFRGLLQLRQGNYQAAITDYQKALEKTPWLHQSKIYEDYSLVARQRLNKQ
jgi:tetratricopeptide (TPR) repeat protein